MIQLDIQIGQYEITPSGNRGDGRVFITILRRDGKDEHDHWYGEERVIDVDALFAKGETLENRCNRLLQKTELI